MKEYYLRSKNLSNSFLFILPLLVLYEIGMAFSGSNVKNSADVMVKTPLAFLGRYGSLTFNFIILIIAFVAVFRLEKKHKLNFRVYIPMFFEAFVYAIILGPLVGRAVAYFDQHFIADPMISGLWSQIILSVGAGVYEEIVFRLILLGGLNLLFIRVLRFRPIASVILSILIGAAAFSGIHYIGSLSDTFTSASFIFRFLAGAVLSAIFMFRGLGIAVYTHAIYDVMLVLRFMGD